MPVFWRSNRDRQAHEWELQRCRLNHPSMGRPGDQPLDPPLLTDGDWAGIQALLAAGPEAPLETGAGLALASLFASLDRLEASVAGEHIVPTSYVTNRVLDVWAAASEVDQQLARPVEEYLSTLVGRERAMVTEITDICDRMRAAAWARA